jgi:hypothetical protein
VILSSDLPLLNITSRCLRLLFAFIASRPALLSSTPTPPSRHHYCLTQPTLPRNPSRLRPPRPPLVATTVCLLRHLQSVHPPATDAPAAPCPTTQDATPALTPPASTFHDPDKDVTWPVNHLTREALRILWHQRLGHMHSRRVSDMHHYAIGIPKLPIATEIDNCPVCIKAKLHKSNKSKETSRMATQCNQGIR